LNRKVDTNLHVLPEKYAQEAVIERDKLWYLKRFNLFEDIDKDERESISDMVIDNAI